MRGFDYHLKQHDSQTYRNVGITGVKFDYHLKQHDSQTIMLARLGISHLASSSYAGISGGERQMVLIARAMAQQAGIVIMDEPTANLDMGNQARVMDQVTRLRQEGYLIILSTHNPQQALSYADRVLALQNGVILAEGPPEQVITEALLEQIYGAPFKIYDIPQENGYLRKVCLPVQPIMSTV